MLMLSSNREEAVEKMMSHIEAHHIFSRGQKCIGVWSCFHQREGARLLAPICMCYGMKKPIPLCDFFGACIYENCAVLGSKTGYLSGRTTHAGRIGGLKACYSS